LDLGLDFGFHGFLDFFWVLGFPSKSNPKPNFFGFEPLGGGLGLSFPYKNDFWDKSG
jgi:hypothetical protein